MKITLACIFLLLGPFKSNLTRGITGEDILLKLKTIVCYISAEKTGSYNKTTGQEQVLVFRTIIILSLIVIGFGIWVKLKIKEYFWAYLLMLHGKTWELFMLSICFQIIPYGVRNVSQISRWNYFTFLMRRQKSDKVNGFQWIISSRY